MRVRSKRGLSDIVTTALIILLVAVAVAAVWSFVSPALRGTGVQFTQTSVCVSNLIEPLACRGTAGNYPARVFVRRTLSDGIALLEEFTVTAAPSGTNSPSLKVTGRALDEMRETAAAFSCDEGTPETICKVRTEKTIAPGEYTFNELVIQNGGVIRLAFAGPSVLTIRAKKISLVGPYANITVNGAGYAGGQAGAAGAGPGGGMQGAGCSGSGGGHGGTGGKATCSDGTTTLSGGGSYGSAQNPVESGSGGGGSASGGGAGAGILNLIVEDTLQVDGGLTATGSDGDTGTAANTNQEIYPKGGGGGAGGTVTITTGALAGTGLIAANGGAGGKAYITGSGVKKSGAGGGAGGRIKITYTAKPFSGEITATGNAVGEGSFTGTFSTEGGASDIVGSSGTDGTVEEINQNAAVQGILHPGEAREFSLGTGGSLSPSTSASVESVYRLPDNTLIKCRSLPITCSSD